MLNLFQAICKSHLSVIKILTILILPILIFSCTGNEIIEKNDSSEILTEDTLEVPSSALKIEKLKKYESPIIGERIDGLANIRNKPNGEIIFELKDDVLVEATPLNGDWYEILILGAIDFDEVGMNAMKANRAIIVDGNSVGKMLKSASFSTGHGRDSAYVMLYGFTHKNNIRPETIIENSLIDHLENHGRAYDDWIGFIQEFNLEEEGIDYKELQTFYNYENSIEDPSPGFRMVLLFGNKELIGWLHSRKITANIPNLTTRQLIYNYAVTFYADYPESKQLDFVSYMNEWVQSVD
jgi:hypothetical protein